MNSTHNIMALIEILLADSGEVGVRELSSRTGIPKSTVQRFISDMQTNGWVYKDKHTQGYRIGYKLLGQSIGWSMRLNLIAQSADVLKMLSTKIGFSTYLCTLDGFSGICIAKNVPDSGEDFPVPLYTLFDLHSCAEGRTLLAFAPAPLINYILYSDMRSFTPNTVTDPKKLQDELEKIRTNGYAVSSSEIIQGAGAIAVPLLFPDGSVNAVISALGKEEDIMSREEELAFYLKRSAAQLQERMEHL